MKKGGYSWLESQALDTHILDYDDKYKNDCDENCSVSNVEVPNKKSRRSSKDFKDLCDPSKKRVTTEVIDFLEKFIEIHEYTITVTELAAYIIKRENCQGKKPLANKAQEILDGVLGINEKSFDLNEALALMHSLTLSKDQMRKLRIALCSKGIHFPTTNELLEARKKLHPVVSHSLSTR